MANAQSIIERLKLAPHPEGGHYRETYRSGLTIDRSCLPPEFSGNRALATAILFLLREGEKSSLHRLRSDEIWHFYLGGPLDLVCIPDSGEATVTTLGPGVEAGQAVQVLAPAGVWMGAYPQPGSGFSLLGCTVSPGFDFADFEMGNRAGLLARFPHLKRFIERLTD